MQLKYFCTVILLVLLSNIAFAQHANHWTFGKNIHLEFKNDTVYQYSINNANWLEGTSTYSDSSGNLKFYTFSAGNKGGGLFRYPNTSMYPHKLSLGDESSTQGWLIVQHPESKTTQLFFSTKEYSTISVILDSIVQDSVIRLPFLGGEKQNAINHKNNRDIWYANHAITGDSIYFFLVKRDQMVCCPIVSYTGLNYENSNGASTQGQIKFNPSGTMLAEAVAVHPFGIGLYHFNNEYPALDSIYVFKKGFDLPYVGPFWLPRLRSCTDDLRAASPA